MTRKKQFRFEQIRVNENVIEPSKELYTTIKGAWRETYFGNNNPIVLELACGQGEYTVGLAQHYPDLNFIGIDRKGDRIARGSALALEKGLINVAFLRTDIHRLLDFFVKDEVNEIWITFPDPQLRIQQAKNRLTHPRYLEIYRQLLVDHGVLHLKTDNEDFFEFSVGVLPRNGFTNLTATRDLYTSDLNNLHFGIKTRFEEIFYAKGFSIKYLQCNKAA